MSTFRAGGGRHCRPDRHRSQRHVCQYVIDPKGKVAYKSGRRPFGFKPGEMEQALVMCLSESGQVQASNVKVTADACVR